MSKMLQTPEATLSYPSLFSPRAIDEGAEPKYEATFVFDEGTDLTELRRAVMEVGKEKWGDKFAKMLEAGKIRLPFRTDGESKGYPDGSVFFAARRNALKDGRQVPAPTVVSVFPDPNNPDRPAIITDPNEVYAGCRVKGLVSCYAYQKAGNIGITFGLEGLQKVRDGDRLDGRVNPQSIFQVDESAFANLDNALDQDDEVEETETATDEAADILGLLGG